ncbi:MAG: hypothetical protein MJE63_07445 [Proteobacteria bacterium]|nr:hypothetical protein [Pseudomonadota bacterium]
MNYLTYLQRGKRQEINRESSAGSLNTEAKGAGREGSPGYQMEILQQN